MHHSTTNTLVGTYDFLVLANHLQMAVERNQTWQVCLSLLTIIIYLIVYQ
jgi:hypothetical protein